MNTHGKTLLYVEPESNGHHLGLYAAFIWGKAIAEGWRILWLTSPHAARSAIAAQLVRHFGENLEVFVYDIDQIPDSGGQPWKWLKYQLQHRRMLKKCIREVVNNRVIDCIFMPWLNYCDRVCGLLGFPTGDIPICGLHMHVAIHEQQSSRTSLLFRVKHALTKRMFEKLYSRVSLKGVAVIIESYVKYAQASRMKGANKLTYIPDVGTLSELPPRDESRKHYSIGNDDIVILVFGAISKRKGVGTLLQAAAATKKDGTLVIILAGKQDVDVETEIESFRRSVEKNATRLISQNTFVNSDDEARLFSAADLVWVGYPGFLGSSGVLIQAGCAGLPVISGEQGEIGRTVKRWQSGLTCNLANTEIVTSVINMLANDSSLRSRLGANGRDFCQQHNPTNFAANIYTLIQATAEQAPPLTPLK